MTTPTTYEEAVEALRVLTTEHANEPYFKKAEIVVSDGFHSVDVWVDREQWEKADKAFKIHVRVNRVPVCFMVQG